MSRRFVDLSIYLENDVITDPPFMRPRIEYQRHGDTMGEAARFFPGLTMENMPGGEGFAAAETVALSTHNGTHLDAPYHFHPTQDGGKQAADCHDHKAFITHPCPQRKIREVFYRRGPIIAA